MARIMLSLCVIPAILACSRAPDLIGVDNPAIPVADVAGRSEHRIFLATSRERSGVPAQFYSRERSEDLGLASLVVSIPPSHTVSTIERARSLPPDPRTQFAVVEPVVYDRDGDFLAALNRELRKRAPQDRSILLYVHGYNNTVSDAVLRLSQFVEDSGFRGVPVLFSWASYARASEYVYDINSALIARVQLDEASDLMRKSIAQRVDLLAWSMGSLAMMEAIVYRATRDRIDRAGRLNTIILASPDIDLDLFRAQLELVPGELDNIYVLTSQDDSALRLSRWIAGAQPRLGQADLSQLDDLGVTVIDLSNVDDVGSRNHGKFSESPKVVQQIGRRLQSDSSLGATTLN